MNEYKNLIQLLKTEESEEDFRSPFMKMFERQRKEEEIKSSLRIARNNYERAREEMAYAQSFMTKPEGYEMMVKTKSRIRETRLEYEIERNQYYNYQRKNGKEYPILF